MHYVLAHSCLEPQFHFFPCHVAAAGVVISAQDKESSKNVAIKKITRAFGDPVDAKRILREIKLMKKFTHENVKYLFSSDSD